MWWKRHLEIALQIVTSGVDFQMHNTQMNFAFHVTLDSSCRLKHLKMNRRPIDSIRPYRSLTFGKDRRKQCSDYDHISCRVVWNGDLYSWMSTYAIRVWELRSQQLNSKSCVVGGRFNSGCWCTIWIFFNLPFSYIEARSCESASLQDSFHWFQMDGGKRELK